MIHDVYMCIRPEYYVVPGTRYVSAVVNREVRQRKSNLCVMLPRCLEIWKAPPSKSPSDVHKSDGSSVHDYSDSILDALLSKCFKIQVPSSMETPG
jgi:hypothetical protein